MILQRSIAILIVAATTHFVSADEFNSFAVRELDEATVGLLRGIDSNAFAAYSKRRKSWSMHSFPSHLTVRPATLGEFTEDNKNDLVVAFELAGGPISELVAIDCKGRFRVHELRRSIDHTLKPVLNGDGVIYYIFDEVIYAFSGKTGTWDTHEVPGLPEVRWIDGVGHVPGIKEHGFDTESEEGIVVRRPNGVAKFLADDGRWTFAPNN